MDRDSIIKGLLSAARQSEDSAATINAGVTLMRPLYDAALAGKTAEDHDRALELYIHAMEYPRQAKRLMAEAEIFRAAAEMLSAGH